MQDNIYGQLIVPVSTLDFWLILLLAPVVALAVDLAFEGFQRRFMPYDYQIIQDMEQSRSNDVVSERWVVTLMILQLLHDVCNHYRKNSRDAIVYVICLSPCYFHMLFACNILQVLSEVRVPRGSDG